MHGRSTIQKFRRPLSDDIPNGRVRRQTLNRETGVNRQGCGTSEENRLLDYRGGENWREEETVECDTFLERAFRAISDDRTVLLFTCDEIEGGGES